jgi:pyruvate-formate lyase-activating enzyme
MPQFVIKPKSMYQNPDEKLSGLGCYTPFNHFEILIGGDIVACCQGWLSVKVGNILTDTPEEIINNPERVRVQNNMKQGILADCNDRCPQLNSLLSGNKNYWSIVPLENLTARSQEMPLTVIFSYDPSCNLQCPSCRNEFIYWDPDNTEDTKGQELLKVHNRVVALIDILLTQDREVVLSITGSGDAFAAPLFWNYLLDLANKPVPKNLRIEIKTNGVLMTKDNWLKIKSLWSIIKCVDISIDAVNEDTYKIVRKNGNLKKLQRNLNDFDQLVLEGNFPALRDWRTNFIIQQDNFKEVKEYVEWQLTFKSKPQICLSLIAQWYHMSEEQFNSMAVWRSNHKQKDELVEILKDPIFYNKQVELGRVSSLMPKVDYV